MAPVKELPLVLWAGEEAGVEDFEEEVMLMTEEEAGESKEEQKEATEEAGETGRAASVGWQCCEIFWWWELAWEWEWEWEWQGSVEWGRGAVELCWDQRFGGLSVGEFLWTGDIFL